MDPKKRARLKAAGYCIGHAEDFLGLTKEESKLIDLRLSIGRQVRAGREAADMTQKQLATRIGSSQSRVAKIEVADGGVSLDLMLRALFAVGGKVEPVLRKMKRLPQRHTKSAC